MGVLRLKIATNGGDQSSSAGPFSVRRIDVTESAETITNLVQSCQWAGGGQARPAGVVAELRSRPGRTVTSWLAESEGRPVGLVAAVESRTAPQARQSIAWLLVADEARRRGVATALVETVRSWARDRGAAELWVETRSDWAQALAFWRAVGFADVPGPDGVR